jgi:cell wall-associated NlpC family hydrolase
VAVVLGGAGDAHPAGRAVGVAAGPGVGRAQVLEGASRSNAREISRLARLSRQLQQDRSALNQLVTDRGRQESELAAVRATVELDLARLRGLRQQIGATSRKVTRTVAPPPAPLPVVSGAAGTAVSFAYAQLGKWYQFGSAGPRTYDCSGLVLAAWRAAGVNLPHSAARQFRGLSHPRRDELRPGDLVFYYADIHHVAMYVGDGTVIHAPNDGEQVRLDRLDLAPVRGYGRPR